MLSSLMLVLYVCIIVAVLLVIVEEQWVCVLF